MKIKLLFLLTIATLVPSACLTAHADVIDLFTLTGTSGTDVITFSLPATPTNTTVNGGEAFVINGPVSVIFNGSAVQAGIEFFNSAYDGGLSIYDLVTGNPFVITTSAQLFTGTLANPGSFILGTTAQTNYPYLPSAVYSENFNLNISTDSVHSTDTGVVPEPSTITLLGMGILGLALPVWSVQSKRNQVASQFFV